MAPLKEGIKGYLKGTPLKESFKGSLKKDFKKDFKGDLKGQGLLEAPFRRVPFKFPIKAPKPQKKNQRSPVPKLAPVCKVEGFLGVRRRRT